MKLFTTIANANVAALDFCMGACISVSISHAPDRKITAWTAALGGLLALAPDVDLAHYWRGRMIADHHRSIMHYPLAIVPAAAVVGWMIGGGVWALIATSCLIAHYIHDMIGPYAGLVALWPFSNLSFGTNGIEKPGVSRRELYIERIGHDAWIRDYWMRPSDLSIFELSAATTFACLASFVSADLWWLPTLSIGSWVGFALCWLSTL